MKIFITFMFAIIIAFSTACDDKKVDKSCESDASADVKEKKKDEKYLCYVGCLEAEGTSKECKKECYGKKGEGDVVDSPDDATATKDDTVSVPDDVSGTNG